MYYTVKQIIWRGIIGIECIFFCGFYIFGSRGLPLLKALRADNTAYIADIMVLEGEIAAIQKEIDEWHTYPFYQEKVAREELQLINSGDTVYFIK